MLSDAVLYAFALCLENWNTAVALRVADNPDDFVWDPEQLTSTEDDSCEQTVSRGLEEETRKERQERP